MHMKSFTITKWPLLLLCTLLLCKPALFGQAENDPGLLSIDRIFNASEFYPKAYFGPARWMQDGSAYTTLETSSNIKQGIDIVKYHTASGERELLVPAEELIPAGASTPLRIEKYSWSDQQDQLLLFTNTARVWRENTRGDYWVFNLKSKTLTKLGGKDAAPSSLMFAKFAPDASRVAYVREHNIYVENLSDHKITALTTNGSKTLINGTFDWVYEEELFLRDGFRWSPNGQQIAYWQLDASVQRDFLMLNTTDSLYAYTIPVQYPKAGRPNSKCRMGVVAATGGNTTWMQIPGDPANNYIARMAWAPNSQEIVIQHLNRYQNELQIIRCNSQNGTTQSLYSETETTWIDIRNDFQWIDQGAAFIWTSEHEGWRNIYRISADGQKQKRLTANTYDVISIELVDEKHGWIYFIASPENATQRYLYRTKLNGKGEAEPVGTQLPGGTHSYDLSPNGRWAFHTHTSIQHPLTIDLVRIPSHQSIRLLADNHQLQEHLDSLKQQPASFFQIALEEDITLDGWMIKPYNFDPTKKYPVLFYVYGEPGAQTVLDRWGWSQYLWHQYLAQEGYIIISIDNRGTPAPKGREWRKCIYQKIGQLNSADQAKAAQIIAQWDFVDANRMAIWGWSGGGSATLNAMFRYPKTYKMGMAVAPVSDLHLYDNIYQERYTGLPDKDKEAYEKGSPINFAKNLAGDLLIVHGTGDDNVHYQSTEKLVNELIKHNKQFQMMAYPNRSHGIYEGPNTRRHLYTLLTNYLKQHLPAGGR